MCKVKKLTAVVAAVNSVYLLMPLSIVVTSDNGFKIA
jgi:hypothetical protein